jgi:hypothetical protein
MASSDQNDFKRFLASARSHGGTGRGTDLRDGGAGGRRAQCDLLPLPGAGTLRGGGEVGYPDRI